MIEFVCNRRHKDGTPIVTDLQVIEYAEAILADYRPDLLEYPGKIDGLHFIEKYLHANIDFQDIYYEEDENPIAGATVFNKEDVKVFDRENKRTKDISVDPDTVIIDNAAMEDGKEGFARFTQLHEGGHFCMHPAVYKRDPYQMSIFDMGLGYAARRSVVMCKRTTLENRKGQLKTQEDFREHQANVFAAALEMPRRAFYQATTRLIREYDLGRSYNDIMVIPERLDFDFEGGKKEVISTVADYFGSSKRATEIQMMTLGLLMTEDQFANRHNILMYRLF